MIDVPNTARETTPLGFGCAFPADTSEKVVSVALETAYEAGVRHFDVAPAYFDGKAERLIGQVLSAAPAITVSTKFGLVPPAEMPPPIRLARAVYAAAKKLVKTSVSAPVPSAAPADHHSWRPVRLGAQARFTASNIRIGVERSLSFLNRGNIDFFSLHEPPAHALETDALDQLIEHLRSRGLVANFGVAGNVERLSSLRPATTITLDFIQTNWDIFSTAKYFGDKFPIAFGGVSRIPLVRARLLAHEANIGQRALQKHLCFDYKSEPILWAVVTAAFGGNFPHGITLFRSSRPDRIKAVVDTFGQEEIVYSSRRLRALLIGGFV